MSEARRGRRLPFVILPWAVLDDEMLTAHDILVYATIARYADGTTGVAWPSRKTVADQARLRHQDRRPVHRPAGRVGLPGEAQAEARAGRVERLHRPRDRGSPADPKAKVEG
jgi:hypothetical protein